ncbi:DJ-1/PfpI family protein [Isoptericola sp. b441]|uniref:DJ-1/PfpI family protein n=1 Tax=Actinotalea lenta TaxID=3064654 RepID=A0ABT9D4N0_9CELL|nr:MULTISPECIES: DJ-1/PfpI family protein [unclassified Isoptericola]MDO8105659.1 DJ-1/PfpI family protein [Isoptericola sp. b441]MDO8122364.1 DJ-1/PfpI family protein [Isoptericola sp. b490]
MLAGRTVGFLTSHAGVEDAELTQPWRTVQLAGGRPVLLAPGPGNVLTVVHDVAPAGVYRVDRPVDRVRQGDLDLLVIPGGPLNADALRTDPDSVRLVREMAKAGKPVAAICHGAWLLVEADVVEGKQLTSYPSLATDIRNAGASWVDEPIVLSGERYPLLTCRRPDDLGAFDQALAQLAA